MTSLNPNKFANECMKCGGLKIERPDGLPLCAECERKMTEEVAQRFPTLAKKGKLALFSEALKK